jgi:hypothetical protein
MQRRTWKRCHAGFSSRRHTLLGHGKYWRETDLAAVLARHAWSPSMAMQRSANLPFFFMEKRKVLSHEWGGTEADRERNGGAWTRFFQIVRNQEMPKMRWWAWLRLHNNDTRFLLEWKQAWILEVCWTRQTTHTNWVVENPFISIVALQEMPFHNLRLYIWSWKTHSEGISHERTQVQAKSFELFVANHSSQSKKKTT